MQQGAAPIRSRLSIILLLTGLNLFNYLDRYVVTAVSPRIQDAFCLSNFQTGTILSAFMVGYFLTSPIFGALGDRYRRKGLIFAGVALWSVATAASGLAAGFLSLLVARLFVGVGEASYATLSPTIIDDLTDSRTKNRWLSLFYVAIPVGSALGYLAGGILEKHFGWRNAFYLAGAPGLVLALAVLAIAEPERKSARTPPVGLDSTKELFARPVYRMAVAGYVAYTFALGGFAAWAPKYLSATLSMPLDQADGWFGKILVLVGLGGTAIGGWLADRMRGEDPAASALRFCAWVTFPAAVFAVVCLLVGSPTAFFAAFAVTGLLLFASTAPINAALLEGVPSELRAQGMAISIFAIHLLGDLLSPPLIGWTADRLGGGSTTVLVGRAAANPACGGKEVVGDLRPAMLLLIPAALLLSAFCWWRGSRPAGKAAA